MRRSRFTFSRINDRSLHVNILGVETSCDETSVAVVADGHHVLSNLVASQIAKHAFYGGVIPELAAREHLNAISPMAAAALDEAKLAATDIEAVAVTCSPGLLPALLVGLSYAKGLAAALEVPLVGVNHILGHVFGAVIDHVDTVRDSHAYPLLALIVSGGHTLLIEIRANGRCRIRGRTLDDAAGEAFDKTARVLNLGYPGGPVIDRLAATGDRSAFEFPMGLSGGGGAPLSPENRFNFSFSGIKTAVLYHVRKQAVPKSRTTSSEWHPLTPDVLPPAPVGGAGGNSDADKDCLNIGMPVATLRDTAASFQEAVVEILVRKTMWAAHDSAAKTVLLGGGVACNSRLRERMAAAADEAGIPLRTATPAYCLDNAAMIGGLAWYMLRHESESPLDIDAQARLGALDSAPFAPEYERL